MKEFRTEGRTQEKCRSGALRECLTRVVQNRIEVYQMRVSKKKKGLIAGLPVLGETVPAVYRSPLGGGERDLALFSTV
jgi:hypothetical protein